MAVESCYLIPILYAVKLPPMASRPYSYFNQYDSRFLKIAEVFSTISKLQKDVGEIYCEREIAIRNRMAGLLDGYQILLFETYDNLEGSPYRIKVVFTDEVPGDGKIDAGTIVVLRGDTTDKTHGLPHLKDITAGLLKERVMEVISDLNEAERATLNQLKETVGFESDFKRIETSVSVSDGFYNRPSIAVLESLRVNLKKDGISGDFSENEVIRLVNLINYARSHISESLDTGDIPSAVSYYFSDVSSSFKFSKKRDRYTEASLRNRGVDDPGALAAAIKSSDKGLHVGGESSNEFITQLEGERQLLDSLVALSASNNVAPVIKLPLSNSDVLPQVSNLASVDRGDGKKINRMMRKLREVFAPHLGSWLEYLDSSPSSAIKFVSNLPLEWAYHQGLPLMVRHEVSRIPVTPGYVTSRVLLDSANIHLALQDFREILFVSSFADDDPIRNHSKK